MSDLFGDDIKLQPKGHGYMGDPGRGPEGTCCKDCQHFTVTRPGANTYFKCGLVRRTRGPGTDIRANMPSCQYFEADEA